MSADRSRGVLYLRLEGPLQSWGESARWAVRDTRLEPTKSGVVGLLAACLGWGPERDREIAALAQGLALAVRADRPGAVLRDYHTVQGGVLSAEGRVKITQATGEPETVVSWRDYLADACFLVALLGEAQTLASLEAALLRPVWPPFLGRKSCPPSRPLYPALPGHPSLGEAAGLAQAVAAHPWLGGQGPGDRLLAPGPVRAVLELAPGERPPRGPAQRRHDVPLSLAPRQFGFRYVYEAEVRPAEEG